LKAIKAGELLELKRGTPGGMAFISTGSMVRTALEIALQSYPDSSVWSAPFIKPIDSSQLIRICKASSAIVVCEEHSVLGGLGSAISEIAAHFAPIRVLRIGVCDRFSFHCGSYEYLLKEHGLDRSSVEQRILDFLAMV
jgi:transketolase